MPYSLDDKLVIGITSRALFDLDESNTVFRLQGLAAYRTYQRQNEDIALGPGTGFPLVRALLAINVPGKDRLVEVIVISRNDADSGIRIFNSIESHHLDISRGVFTDGRDASPYLRPFRCDLFLSADPNDVKRALKLGFAAAMVCTPPESIEVEPPTEVRVAFDGDAVLFDGESERVYQQEGLEAFLERETRLANEPMHPGPFKSFLMGLKHIQERFPEEGSPIRTALVTSRNAPAHKRVVNTLRAWGVRVDETFFLGGVDKGPVLEVLRPHIYFDDQMSHLESARFRTPSAQVIPIDIQIPLPLQDGNEHAMADGIEADSPIAALLAEILPRRSKTARGRPRRSTPTPSTVKRDVAEGPSEPASKGA